MNTLFRTGASALIIAAALVATPVWAQEAPPAAAADVEAPAALMEMSLEDLLTLESTSVAKKRQRVSDSAAAVYVITQEDIRRSTANSIPELLRMVPGVEVGQQQVGVARQAQATDVEGGGRQLARDGHVHMAELDTVAEVAGAAWRRDAERGGERFPRDVEIVAALRARVRELDLDRLHVIDGRPLVDRDDDEVAAYAKRCVVIKDGMIESDQAVKQLSLPV